MAVRQLAPASPVATPPTAEDAVTTGIALFDLDRTLIPGSSVLALGRRLARDGVVSRRALAEAAVHDARFRRRGATDADAERLRTRALRAIAGLERSALREVVNRVGREVARTASPGARMLLDRHRGAGDLCVVLSASPQELVEVVSDEMGASCGIGTRAMVVDGRLTGGLDGPFCYGAGKLARLRDRFGVLDLRNAWAYADSASDLPLLEACGHPVAVNPDRALNRVAKANGWPIVVVA